MNENQINNPHIQRKSRSDDGEWKLFINFSPFVCKMMIFVNDDGITNFSARE